MSQSEFSERARHLLKVLIERYISDGNPVGSRILARDSGMDLSPATVRNVMADLEDLGLIRSPHTSAGRVPTAQGYRLFVDNLLTIKPLNEAEIHTLQDQLQTSHNTQKVLETATAVLSEMTQLAGVVMVPRREQATLRQVEFLPLSDNRVLVILVVNEREVQNRIIHPARPFTPSELQQMANYINQKFAGCDLKEVHELLVKDLGEVREHVNRMMLDAVEMANRIFRLREEDSDYLMSGQTRLMSYHEMADVEKLKQLFDAFNQKRDILHLLDQSLQAEGVQLYIGEESGYEVLDDCSLVTSPYEVEGDVVGVIGVIGPTRMAYDRVIPTVDVAAKLLTAVLNRKH